METKSIKTIKLSEKYLEKIGQNYGKSLLNESLTNLNELSEFYRNIKRMRQERYYYIPEKKVYYDFKKGALIGNFLEKYQWLSSYISGFVGRWMTEEERKDIRILIPKGDSKKIYVDCNIKKSGDGTSWEKAFKTIGEAIENASGENEEILISSGSYRETVNLKSNITLHGGFLKEEKYLWKKPEEREKTLITGGINIKSLNNINLSNIYISMEQKFKESQRYGLYIVGAKNINLFEVNLVDNKFQADQYNKKAFYSSNSEINCYYCKINNNSNFWHNNYATIYGGAVYLNNVSGIFYKCEISNNSNENTNNKGYEYGGAIYLENGSSRIKFIGCNFKNNFGERGKDIYIASGEVEVYGEDIGYYNGNLRKIQKIELSIEKKVEKFRLPIHDLVEESENEEKTFYTLFLNKLIDILENSEENNLLRKNLKIDRGFSVDKIFTEIWNNGKKITLPSGDIISKEEIINKMEKGIIKIKRENIEEIFLNCDRERADITPYDRKILEDINRGHWDLWEDNLQGEYKIQLEEELIGRNPRADINNYGTVAIDFGTKSTVVVYQRDDENVYIKRVGAGDLEKDVSKNDYENPTVLEFRNLEKFMEDYGSRQGRPKTSWEDLTTSYTAFNRMLEGDSKDYYSVFADLKQWAGKGKKIKIKDKNGGAWDLPEFKYLDLESDMNPIEIYGYYIGLCINNMHGDGIFIDYILSFPVKYERELCEKIRESFERGLKKSLPESILNDEEVMEEFQVRIGASEPAAYAVCALEEYGFEPVGDEKICYGIFDFGGGTTDFDFGIWKEYTKSRSYDYEIEHFYDNGDRYLGGENLLQLLAFEIFKMESNQKVLKENKITFILPPESLKYPGSETLITDSQEAELNMRKLMEECRYFWEHDGESFKEQGESSNYEGGVLVLGLYDTNGELKQCELNIDEELLKNTLKNRIDKGVVNFFESWREAYASTKEECHKLNIFLAGNSSKSKLVKESFENNINKIIENAQKINQNITTSNFEIFPPLGTEEALEKQREKRGAIVEEIVPPTGKTGVAYGLIRSRESGKIKVTKRESNRGKYFIGIDIKGKLEVIIKRDVLFNQWIEFFPGERREFEIYYTDIPEATTNGLSIRESKKIRCKVDERDEDKNIYVRLINSQTLEYTLSSEEEIKDHDYRGKIYRKELKD